MRGRHGPEHRRESERIGRSHRLEYFSEPAGSTGRDRHPGPGRGPRARRERAAPDAERSPPPPARPPPSWPGRSTPGPGRACSSSTAGPSTCSRPSRCPAGSSIRIWSSPPIRSCWPPSSPSPGDRAGGWSTCPEAATAGWPGTLGRRRWCVRSCKAELSLAAELTIDTGAGPRRVRVEPGHRLDPLTRPTDPRNPADTPLGQHLVCEILPALRDAGTRRPAGEGWLAGLEALDDPASFPRFVASRLAYRRVGRHAWWLLLPLLIAVVLRLPIAIGRRAHHHVAIGHPHRPLRRPGHHPRPRPRRPDRRRAGAADLAGPRRRRPQSLRRPAPTRTRRPGPGPGTWSPTATPV